MKNQINIADIPGNSQLIKDYITKEEKIASFYGRNLSPESLLIQAREKISNYKHREKLVDELQRQLKNLQLSEKQTLNLKNLSLANSITVTTGHQLNLMTGPLYFIYKILQVIKLCDTMNERQEEFKFIPIFWMATEDHDFEEINHFNFNREFISWNEKHHDYVGEISTGGLKTVLSDFYEELKYYPFGKELRKIIEKSYYTADNLSDATRILVHELFKEYGLLFIDGNTESLKKLFIPFIKDDIKEKKSFRIISKTIEKLKSNHYKIQVNPRKINFFYHKNKERNRIDETNGKYYILGSCKNFSEVEILKEIDKHPENFSPNALMRPVYQEVILPNVAYIGGNAEIAYWMELKDYFSAQNIPFPILVPRNSFLLINDNQEKRMKRLSLNINHLFLPKEQTINTLVTQNSSYIFDFAKYESRLKVIFDDLLKESANTDPSWKNMILAQKKKQLNGLEKINKRFYKANRLKHKEIVYNFEKLYEELFPEGSWQERVYNFSFYYATMGSEFLARIYNEIDEFQNIVTVFNLEKGK